MAATIIASGRPDPRLDSSGNKCLQLKRQLKGYKAKDNPTNHQKALVPEIYRFILRHYSKPRELARAHLLSGALFFAMRSCEYSKTANHDNQKTKPIRPMDVIFRIGNKIIQQGDPKIFMADTVELTFQDQKNGEMEDQVIQERTNDPELCPVSHWAHTITRLRAYPGYRNDWPVFHFYDEKSKKHSHITSTEILQDIRAAVDAIGPDVLGFTSKEVGTHSNRSGAAMMMYLSGTPVYSIMLVGRWLSDAFLRYIEKQVKEFSRGITKRMLSCNTFYNIPLRPWQPNDTANSKSAAKFLHKPLNNIFGPQRSSLRSQLRPSFSPKPHLHSF